jgi:tetratricopeptide (TPR) repeat protein
MAALATCAAAMVCGAALAQSEPPAAQSLADVERSSATAERDLSDIEAKLRALAGALDGTWLDRPELDPTKRLVDAQVFYETGRPDLSAIVLVELVEKERFASRSDWEEAAMLLAKSLVAQRNWDVARDFLRHVAERSPGRREEALSWLVEVGIESRQRDVVTEAVSALRPAIATGEGAYALGKGEWHLDEPERAKRAFSGVAATASTFAAAQYYLGVIATQQEQYPQALEYFRAAAQAATAPNHRQIAERAAMSEGRLCAELGDIDCAAEAYQSIDRNSPQFERALLELSWAYLNAERIADAKHALDIVLLVAKDRRLVAQAAILRGSVLERQGEIDSALESYDAASTSLVSIERELAELAKSEESLDAYFNWVIQSSGTQDKLPSPLSPAAEGFVSERGAMSGFRQLLGDVGAQERDLAEIEGALEQLEAALDAQAMVDLFPKLQSSWVQAVELENGTILLERALLDLEHAVHALSDGGTAPAALREAASARRAVESQFLREVPQTAAAYQSRAKELDQALDELRKKAFVAKQAWKDAAEQLEYLENWMANSGEAPAGEGAQNGRAELAVERMLLDQILSELAGIERAIEVESARSGVAQVARHSQANLKNRVFELQMAEHALYANHRKRLSGAQLAAASRIAEMRDRGWKVVDGVGDLVRRLQARVDAKASEMKAIVEAERKALPQLRREVAAAAHASRQLAASAGYALVRSANEDVAGLVLEAEVGVLDAVWRRKEQKAAELRGMREEAGQRLEEIRRALVAIDRAESSGQSAAPAGAPQGGDNGAP